MKIEVMGILNCTPDSFFAGSRKQTEMEISQRAEQILTEGGSIIDVGGYSTRPGAAEVTEEEEMRRLRMALTEVRRVAKDAVISVDTFRPTVARMAAEEYGVSIINDVSEGKDADMFPMVGRLGVRYVLMSLEPTMERIINSFRTEVEELHNCGCHDIILDPGFGFGKDVIRGNYEVLRRLSELCNAFPTLPVLAGMSRKRMAWMPLNTTPDSPATLHATLTLNIMAVEAGATILRVHDVADTMNTIKTCFSPLA